MANQKRQEAPMDWGRVPGELLRHDRWLRWAYRPRGPKKWCKPPLDPRTGRAADPSDPATWASFADLADALWDEPGASQVGFALAEGDPWVVVDLDDAVVDGVVAPWAAGVVGRLGSFVELSPSGAGLHVWVRVTGPKPANRKGSGVEVLASRTYATLTGARPPGLGGCDAIRDRTEELWSWYREAFPAKPPAPAGAGGRPTPAPGSPEAGGSTPEDPELLDRCRRAFPGFAALYDRGDLATYGGDHSRADQALLATLVRAGVGDPVALDRLFRTSALVRGKWLDREDYRRRSIAKALESVGEAGGTADPAAPLRRRVANLEQELGRARARDEANSRLFSLLARIRANRTLGPARNTLAALVVAFKHFEDAGAAKPYPTTAAGIARMAGVSAQAARDHLARFERPGLYWSRREWGQVVDPVTGEVLGPKTSKRLAPATDALTLAERLAGLDGGSRWGGKRERRREGEGVPAAGARVRGRRGPTGAAPGRGKGWHGSRDSPQAPGDSPFSYGDHDDAAVRGATDGDGSSAPGRGGADAA